MNNEEDNFQLCLFLGGARSGKSSFAEKCARHFSSVMYFATAHVVINDAEMQARIKQHVSRRPKNWTTLEPPSSLEELKKKCTELCPEAVLIDCATLWLGHILSEAWNLYSKPQLQVHLEQECKNFVYTLSSLPAHVFIVSNETGQGVVPEHASGRIFRDYQGILNALIADKATHVVQSVAGLSLLIKGQSRFSNGFDPVASITNDWLIKDIMSKSQKSKQKNDRSM